MKKRYLQVCGVVFLLAFAACGSSGGGSSSTDAAFPTSVGVDVSAVSSANLQNVNFSVSKAGIPDTGTMSAPITTATDVADLVNKLSDNLFSGIAAALNSELALTSTQISGTAFGGTVKVDFSNYNYDVDGDGTNDPCSGTAAISSSQYACFRAWFNDSRLMIGYVQTAPTSDTAGKGVVIVSPTLVADAATLAAIGMGNDVMAYLVWNNTAASTNSFDGYASGTMATGKEFIVGRIVSSSDAENKVTLQTAAFFATDQIIPIPNPPPGGGTTDFTVDQVLFNSQFIVAGTNLLFENHFYLDGASVADQQNDTPFCGVIATGDPASGGNPADVALCTAEGISLTGIEYPTLAASDASKTQFPAASVFPETPTF